MEAEVGETVGEGKGERTPEERETWRNGYRRRDWEQLCRILGVCRIAYRARFFRDHLPQRSP